jgi:hypothetical protein
MGFLDQYRDRGPTVGEVWRARKRLLGEMLVISRRAADPARTVFTGKPHVEALRAALVEADPDTGCVVVGLASAVDGVCVLDATDDVVGIPSASIAQLATAIAGGEAPAAAVIRIAHEARERERLVHENPELAAQIREDVAAAGRGEIVDPGSFAQHLTVDDRVPPGTVVMATPGHAIAYDTRTGGMAETRQDEHGQWSAPEPIAREEPEGDDDPR